MANLAIKGHATRGKEVIEILEMLGGKNRHEYVTDSDCFGFFIGNETTNKTIYYDWLYNFHDEDVIFTLEEFLEKFPYKVGDKVKIKETGKDVTIEGMSWRNGREVIYDTCYNNDCVAFYSAEELQPYKEAPRYLNEKANKQAKEIEKLLEPVKEIIEEIKIDIPKGYKFAGVDAQQVVFEKVKPKYPKTYEECVELDGTNFAKHLANPMNKYGDLLLKFNELLLCRDAYWKIAGEQMGLGKPWEPDYTNDDVKFCICYCSNLVVDGVTYDTTEVFVFPTAEMRAAFRENFKDLIEQCKKLL